MKGKNLSRLAVGVVAMPLLLISGSMQVHGAIVTLGNDALTAAGAPIGWPAGMMRPVNTNTDKKKPIIRAPDGTILDILLKHRSQSGKGTSKVHDNTRIRSPASKKHRDRRSKRPDKPGTFGIPEL